MCVSVPLFTVFGANIVSIALNIPDDRNRQAQAGDALSPIALGFRPVGVQTLFCGQ